MENWTLGKFTNWVIKNNLVEKRFFEILQNFNEVRNAIVHHRYGMYNIMNDINRLNFLTKLMLKICDFIDNTSIERKHDKKSEEKYTKILEKERKRYEKAFSKNKINKVLGNSVEKVI